MTSQATVLLTRRWPKAVEHALASRYAVTTNPEDQPMSQTALALALRNFDFVCPTVTDRISADLLASGAIRAKALCNFGAGVNHIDLAACVAAGLIVTNTPDVLTDDTADLAIMLALMCARRAGEGERLVRRGAWQGWAPTHMLGHRLSGKSLGIVGFGRIGQATAQRGRNGFGMKIIYTTRTPDQPPPAGFADARAVELDQLFEEADVISLHIPGGGGNRGLVDGRRLALMKPTAILVNTARGDIIDEPALIAALNNGTIAAAGLDVYGDEPRVPEALARLENVVLLPHLGSATDETRIAMGLRALANLDAIASGDVPPDRVAHHTRSQPSEPGS